QSKDLAFVLHHLPFLSFKYRVKDKKNFVIVGEQSEAERVSKIIKHNLKHSTVIGYVSPNEDKTPPFMGRFSQLKETVRIHQAHEVIFCAKNARKRLLGEPFIASKCF
ncbi:MAG: hypothetical protein CSA19_01900, partial [Deltaproteobacteria bacterium]